MVGGGGGGGLCRLSNFSSPLDAAFVAGAVLEAERRRRLVVAFSGPGGCPLRAMLGLISGPPLHRPFRVAASGVAWRPMVMVVWPSGGGVLARRPCKSSRAAPCGRDDRL